MRRSMRFGLCTLLTVVCFSVGCGQKDARAIWNQGLKKCAINDQLGPNVLYFGPSNALGPGTIFQKFSDKGIQVSHLLKEYGSTDLYAPAQTFQCSAVSNSSFKLNGSATLPNIIPVSGTFSGNISTASSVTVNADQLIWDQLVTGDFKTKVLGLPDGNSVKPDLLDNHQLVLSRALKVKGMTAVVEFTHDNGVNAKANIPNGKLAGAGIDLTAEWTGDTKLTITAPADFYIAGELRTFDKNGLAGPGNPIGPLVPKASALQVKQ